MPDRSGEAGRVVVAGASGLIGRALVDSLRADGVPVTELVRRPPESPDEVQWLADSKPLDPAVLDGAAAVVGLNGASIGKFPWTRSYKSTLLWSRLTPTRTIARAVRELGSDAPAFVSGSAVGYYGSAPGVRLTEQSPRGRTLLADICVEWERSALGAGDDARVVLARTATVLDPGGVLKPLMLLTRFGVAGPIGRGTQVWPWISLADEVRALRLCIDGDLSGPVNLAGPTRETANDIGFALARRMNRPYALRAPGFALRAVLGADAAESVLMVDAEVVPAVLDSAGFTFEHPTAESAIAAVVPAA